jgi:uncharacterized protein with PIN domain
MGYHQPKPVSSFPNREFKRHINKHFKLHENYARQFYLCVVCKDRYWVDLPKGMEMTKMMKDNAGNCGHNFYYRHVKF